ILSKNYRSTKKILEAANNLIKYNHNRFNKNLVTDNYDGAEIREMYSKYSLRPFFGLVISHDLIPSNNARIFSSPVP
ncbi:3'-5' exonuclease, partial [Mycoplasmopsis bovis]|uniref:3'-5' exonuclease n=1 Tax=Mycoplasmopsis bovis TaxID=28903 RepID=UPI003D268007